MPTSPSTPRAISSWTSPDQTSRSGVTRADILASHAELADEIDLIAARRRLDEWENRSAEDANGVAKGEIAKAMARIKLVG
jgi:F0F1-type ATP synthase epsilon subunit